MEKIFCKKPPYPVHAQSDFYESKTWAKKGIISGIDEVGRGCLAGPVVACAVVLYPHFKHPLLKDSKILTENQRNVAAALISAHSWHSFGIIDHTLIDQHNIYQATLMAMKRAYYGLITLPNLPQLPELVVVDAMPLKLGSKSPEVLHFTQGESKSISIAAASILAKVMRDNLMARLEKTFPGYSLGNNKGYGAPQHFDYLQQYGMSLIHRKSFLKKLDKGNKHEDHAKQKSLFC
jgi:ribonuclease HII